MLLCKQNQTICYGAVLFRQGRAVAYYSRKMSAAERNYVVTEQELLATVEAMRVFRCYLLSGQQFTLVTDNQPNTFLQTQPHLSHRQARWSEYLQRFNLCWVHKPGRHNVADPLSRNSDCRSLNALIAVATRRSAHKHFPSLLLQLQLSHLLRSANAVMIHLLLVLTLDLWLVGGLPNCLLR